jgi:hypothetical protein
MCVAPVPPGSDGARFHRAIDALEFHNPFARDLPERHQAWWPRANGNHERDERFANGRLEAGSYSDTMRIVARLYPPPKQPGPPTAVNRQSNALTRQKRTSVKSSLTLFLLFMARQGQAP